MVQEIASRIQKANHAEGRVSNWLPPDKRKVHVARYPREPAHGESRVHRGTTLQSPPDSLALQPGSVVTPDFMRHRLPCRLWIPVVVSFQPGKPLLWSGFAANGRSLHHWSCSKIRQSHHTNADNRNKKPHQKLTIKFTRPSQLLGFNFLIIIFIYSNYYSPCK